MTESYNSITPRDTHLTAVEWHDINKIENWNDDEEVNDVVCWTSGWLLEDNENEIVLGGTYEWLTGTWSDIHTFSKATPELVPDGKLYRSRKDVV